VPSRAFALEPEAQVGEQAVHQAFRSAADMHTYTGDRAPWGTRR